MLTPATLRSAERFAVGLPQRFEKAPEGRWIEAYDLPIEATPMRNLARMIRRAPHPEPSRTDS